MSARAPEVPATPAAVEAEPDAALVALGAEFVEKDSHITSPAYDADDAFYSAEHDRWWQIVDRATDLPARTETGRGAKATILAAVIRDCCRKDDPDALLALSDRSALSGER